MATYKEAGVDIAAGDDFVKQIKPLVRSTFSPRVLSDIGHFGAFFDARFAEYQHPVLVSSVDGVGTKLKIGVMLDRHNTVGQDLVNHCVNDIAVCGAIPLFFLDYFATGKLEPRVAVKVVEGFSIACKENGCALVGGETAEMPGMYQVGDYDIAGCIVGVVDKDNIINGSRIQRGDVLIGAASTGLHTNGYSLARKVLLDRYALDTYVPEISGTLGDALLAVHRSYFPTIQAMMANVDVRGFSHITGGGIVGNTSRILPEGMSLNINWNTWTMPPIFPFIQKVGGIDNEDMRRTFNLGIGLIAVVAPKDVDRAMSVMIGHGERAFVIGEVA